MSDTEQPTKKYRGNCHCGAFVYEVEAPEITSVSDCNCSICYKQAYLWLVPGKPLTVVKDEGKLVHYSFGTKNMDHQFCGNCGTTVLAKSSLFPQGLGLNARTIQGLDLWSLEIKTFNGADIGTPYVPPPFTGEDPTPADFENPKTYHGACHCGAVTTAVTVDGDLEAGTYKNRIMECNCSFCRQGYVWIYPTSKQLAIHGRENVFHYAFANHIWRKLFCKTCGVHIGSEVNPDATEEDIAALPEAYQKHRAAHLDVRPLNLRILAGLDVKKVETKRGDGWSMQNPQYVYP